MLIPLWAVIAAAIFLTAGPRPHVAIIAVGAVLGAVGGWLQHVSLREATSGFSRATSLLEIRRAFKATKWGRCYLVFLYVSKATLLLTAIFASDRSFIGILIAYIVGYFALMFVREVVTLRDTFYLRFALSSTPRNESDA